MKTKVKVMQQWKSLREKGVMVIMEFDSVSQMREFAEQEGMRLYEYHDRLDISYYIAPVGFQR